LPRRCRLAAVSPSWGLLCPTWGGCWSGRTIRASCRSRLSWGGSSFSPSTIWRAVSDRTRFLLGFWHRWLAPPCSVFFSVFSRREDGGVLEERPARTGWAVQFQGLGHAYHPGHWVFRNYTALIKAGSIFAVLGPNGRGKTTLLNILLGIFRPEEGEVH